ncbi:unnamed protein product [Cuscuta epithymum]|uniref:Uncharacterized protein n=1 Tax=Cuscuta epithymum TaxID=186058 RepID=A0AAV0FJ68_9ASTE|nr:unnamed protein product [Cuscuta epithymum]
MVGIPVGKTSGDHVVPGGEDTIKFGDVRAALARCMAVQMECSERPYGSASARACCFMLVTMLGQLSKRLLWGRTVRCRQLGWSTMTPLVIPQPIFVRLQLLRNDSKRSPQLLSSLLLRKGSGGCGATSSSCKFPGGYQGGHRWGTRW